MWPARCASRLSACKAQLSPTCRHYVFGPASDSGHSRKAESPRKNKTSPCTLSLHPHALSSAPKAHTASVPQGLLSTEPKPALHPINNLFNSRSLLTSSTSRSSPAPHRVSPTTMTVRQHRSRDSSNSSLTH